MPIQHNTASKVALVEAAMTTATYVTYSVLTIKSSLTKLGYASAELPLPRRVRPTAQLANPRARIAKIQNPFQIQDRKPGSLIPVPLFCTWLAWIQIAPTMQAFMMIMAH
jgi:hypothetical protein